MIKEGDLDGKGSIICGGDVREKAVYISDSHQLRIEIFTIEDSTKAHFLLKYQGIKQLVYLHVPVLFVLTCNNLLSLSGKTL